MERGDGMRNGDADSAVRILPNDATAPSPPPRIDSAPRLRWYIPLAAVVGVVALFAVATRPGEPPPTTTTTPPARIADVDAALIDLRTSSTPPIADDWLSAFEGSGRINDIVRASSSFVAVGYSEGAAQVWLSGTGSNWRLVQRLDRPDSSRSSIDHAVYRDNYTVALGTVDDGVGAWTANEVSAWKYHGIVAGMDRIAYLVSGPEIMAITELPDGGFVAWSSANGVDWTEIGELDLSGLFIVGFTADDDYYYAFGGHDCPAGFCPPEIVRSVDGRSWESVGKDLLPNLAEGMVTDIVVTKEGLRAVGWGSVGSEIATHLWESRNGREWFELPGAADQIHATSTELVVLATGLEPGPWAQLVVEGTTVDAAIGSTIKTDTGHLEVVDITADAILVAGSDGPKNRIAVGAALDLEFRPLPRHIAAQGPRIVITGHLFGTDGVVETAWLSVDGGNTWAWQPFPDMQGDVGAITAGASIVVYGESGGSPTVWRNAWDTETAGLLAEDLVADYIHALNGDLNRMLAVLPRWDEGSAPPQLSVPTLGDHEPTWWDTETGEVVPSLVEDTLGYLTATDTQIRLDGCVSVVSLGALDRVSVRCDYTADSALLSLFGLEGQSGKINAVVRNGRLSELLLDTAPSTALWRVMANFTDLTAHHDANLAAVHLAAAEESLSQVLHPGATRTVDTSLGVMEWTWLEPVELGDTDYINSVVWSDLGFVAVGFVEGALNPAPTIWRSDDGRDWEELPGPERSEGLWELQPFAGGLLGQAWVQGQPQLVHFDGASWHYLSIPKPDASLYQDYSHLAVSGDQALVITTWWDDDGLVARNATILSEDLEQSNIQLPAELATYNEGAFDLAGSDSGFLIATGGLYGAQDDLSLWATSAGTDWRLLAQTSTLDDAQYIWNLEQHRSQYFVVGETLELRCSSQEPQRDCMNVVGLWSSGDGTEWDRVRTETGEPLATRAVGSGPLGLVAFGQEFIDATYPRSVFVSADGQTWATAGGLALLDTSAEWWWSSTPAVGIDTVITAGTGFRATSGIDSSRPFLIIGRVVDP